MPQKHFIVLFCDRCDAEVDKVEVPDGGTIKRAPDYYRQVRVEDATGIESTEEKGLDVLCRKCKKAVAELDRRIFGGARTEQPKEGEPNEPASE